MSPVRCGSKFTPSRLVLTYAPATAHAVGRMSRGAPGALWFRRSRYDVRFHVVSRNPFPQRFHGRIVNRASLHGVWRTLPDNPPPRSISLELTDMLRLNDATGGTPLHQLKITLCDCKPAIWRRVVVRSDMKLDRLHRVFQTSMGWTNSHLHQFIKDEVYYGQPDQEWDAEETKMLNEKHYTVADLAPAVKARFTYEYDFGDCWQHEVVLEEIVPPDAEFKHPRCLDGANACPPEDCGGSDGYASFLHIMANPKHEEHKFMKRWIGGKWDAALFDVEHVNAALKRIKA